MYTDLVRPPGFEFAFYQCYIAEAFQYGVMCYGFLAMFALGIGIKEFALLLVAAHVRDDGAIVFCDITPNQSMINTVNCMIKKLLCQGRNSFFSFSYHH